MATNHLGNKIFTGDYLVTNLQLYGHCTNNIRIGMCRGDLVHSCTDPPVQRFLMCEDRARGGGGALLCPWLLLRR